MASSTSNRRGSAAEATGPSTEPQCPAVPGSRPRLERPKRLLPEDHLERAMAASSPKARGRWARRGLAHRGPLDPTTQAMLLRQLYLSHFAERRFEQAYEIATQALELGILMDVVHQDAARARLALGDTNGATGHLRLAARLGPPSRRAFHCWTLGSILYLAGRHSEAASALSRAVRWGTTDRPLYEGHLACARLAAGTNVRGLERLIEQLECCPAGQGYGRFVLGLLCMHAGRTAEAKAYLRAFVDRTVRAQPTMAIALEGELRRACEELARIEGSTSDEQDG